MGIPHSQIDDLVSLTQEQLVKRGAFVNLTTDLTDHVACREVWKGRQKQFSGGEDWQFDVMTDHNHSARFVGLYETDGSAFNDVMAKGRVSVRHLNAYYVYDLHEPDFQKGGTKIVDYVMTKYIGMQISVFELMEDALWGKPADASDLVTPYGVAFWVTKHPTANAEGFGGGDPAGFPLGRAGLSSTTYPRWANYAARYTAITKEDLVRKMRRAHRMTQFRSPVSHSTPDVGSMRNGIYTNDDVIGLLEEVCEDQNMSLGNDLDSKGGRVLFKGTPLTYVPKLDGDSTDPVYMLDWKTLAVGVLDGWENQLTKPTPVPGMHLVRRVDLDASMNMICTDLRKQAVLSK